MKYLANFQVSRTRCGGEGRNSGGPAPRHRALRRAGRAPAAPACSCRQLSEGPASSALRAARPPRPPGPAASTFSSCAPRGLSVTPSKTVQQGVKLPTHTWSRYISLFLPFSRQILTVEMAVELTASPAVIAGRRDSVAPRVPTAPGGPGCSWRVRSAETAKALHPLPPCSAARARIRDADCSILNCFSLLQMSEGESSEIPFKQQRGPTLCPPALL